MLYLTVFVWFARVTFGESENANSTPPLECCSCESSNLCPTATPTCAPDIPLGPTCIDDYSEFRGEPFNLVEKTINHIHGECLRLYRTRVLIQSLNLTNSLSPIVQQQDLRLSYGCLIQTITVSRNLHPSLDCTMEPFECKVTIRCVVPRVVISYSYELDNIQNTRGMVTVDVHDGPIDLVLTLERDNFDRCTILNELDDALLARYHVMTNFLNNENPQYTCRLNQIMEELLQTGWPYYTYKEEVKQFLIEILLEFYYRNFGVFNMNEDYRILKQTCKSLSVKPIIPTREPTSPYPTAVPTIYDILPLTCKDEYYNDRTKYFNIVNPTRVVRMLDCCNNPEKQWLMIGDIQLSPYFQKAFRIQNVYLSNGCLVQSIIVPRQAPLQVSWDRESNQATVSISCVVPRIVVGYDYTFNTGTENVTGSATIEVQEWPIVAKVDIQVTSNRKCFISYDNVMEVTSKLKKTLTLDREMPQVQSELQEFLTSYSWFQSVCELEIRTFIIRVIQEALSQSSNVFLPITDIAESCEVVMDNGSSSIVPALPFNGTTINPTGPICIDDYEGFRVEPFNLVQTTKVTPINNINGECLRSHGSRVLIQSLNLTNSFVPKLQVQDLLLSNGCLVQSITVDRDLQLSLDCTTGSFVCKVTFHCVVPRLMLTFTYELAELLDDPGMVMIDVHDGPIDLVLTFERDNNDRCTILNELDDAMLAKYRVVMKFVEGNIQPQNLYRVKMLMEELVKNGWLYYAYKEEVKQFIIETFVEFYVQDIGIFSTNEQQRMLKQFCKSLTIQPNIPTEEPTSPYPTAVSTIYPDILPMTCKDEYFYDRRKYFNIINPTTIVRNLGSCNNPNTEWLMIGDRQLSPYFQKTFRIQNVYLSNGCLVQSIIIPRQAPFHAYWEPNSNKATVTIPCVVPRIVIGYEYTFNTGTENVRGSATIEVQDVPIVATVEIQVKSNRKCIISYDNVKEVTSNLKMSLTLDREMQQVQYVIQDFIRTNSWIYNVCEQEIRTFIIRVIQEASSRSNYVFPPLMDIMESCDIIEDNGTPIGPVFPTNRTVIIPMGPTCVDDFSEFRRQPFNLVQTTKVTAINNINGECLRSHGSRVLIQSLNLTNTFFPKVQVQDLLLSNGCLVQSITVDKDLQLSLDCTTGSFVCKVTFHCVVPRLMLTYTYELAELLDAPGMVMIDVHDGPIDLVLTFERDNYDRCTILNELDDAMLAKYRVVMKFVEGNIQPQNLYRVKMLMEELVKNGWPYYAYKEEVKQFIIEIFVEFYDQNIGMFSTNEQQRMLKQFCKSLTIQPNIPTQEPTSPYPTAVPTIHPDILPMTCKDDYLYDRRKYFNIINPTTIVRNLGSCNNLNTEWLMIGDRQLSPYFQKTFRIQNVYLSNGCLVQSIIIPRQAPFHVHWEPNSNKATVTIPCVVPRIVIGYEYTFNTGIENVKGSATIEVQDVPIVATVEIQVKSNRKCIISYDNVKEVTSNLKMSLTLDREMQQVQYVIQDFIRTNSWIYDVCKQEIRTFIIRVIQEASSCSNYVFPPLLDVMESCDIIEDNGTPIGPVFPTNRTVIIPMGPTCVDDFSEFRRQPFNLVQTTKVTAINNINGECLRSHGSRVLIQSLNLTNTFFPKVQVQDLLLSNGCLVQSITVDKDLQLSLDCTTGSFVCKVTFHCVVPRLMLTYTYELAELLDAPGMVMIDVHDGPIDLVLTFERDNYDRCTILNELDDAMLANYRVVMKFVEGNTQPQYMYRVKMLMDELIKHGWPYYAYKEEVKQFIIEIFVEFYDQNIGIFSTNEQQRMLKQFCKSLTIQPNIPTQEPTSPHPTAVPTIHPDILPMTCKDDYFYDRRKYFNIINPTTIVRNLGSCNNLNTEWLMIGDRQLSPYFQKTFRIQNVDLSNGCLVQSIIIPRQAPFHAYWEPNSNKATVTIPCVVPRIVIGYEYTFNTGIENVRGSATIEVQDVPIVATVEIQVKSNRKCIISYDNVKEVTSNLKMSLTLDREMQQVQYVIQDFMRTNSWIYNVCEQEIRTFIIRVIQEASSRSSYAFPPLMDIMESCDIIESIPKEEPATSTSTPLVGPPFLPPTCRDKNLLNRMEKFNIVDPLKDSKFINGDTCVSSHVQRVLIKERQLFPYALESKSHNFLVLVDGCLVQSITVPYRAQLVTDCIQGSNKCIVTIPCVVPNIEIGYNYFYNLEGGTAFLEFYDYPITIKVTVDISDTRICSIISAIDEELLSDYKVSVHTQSKDHEVETIIRQLIDKRWLYEVYKQEIKAFTVAVILGAFSQTGEVFSNLIELHRYCDVISDNGTPIGPVFPTNRTTTLPMGPICIDDYSEFRRQPFNLVQTTKVTAINKINGGCLRLRESRVLIQSLNLTNSFSPNVQLQDLQLSNGCLVQSNTVNRDLQLSLDCTTGSFQCKVTIPCVVPRVVMGFSYVLVDTGYAPGIVKLDVHDGPIDLVLTLVRENDGRCTILNELDDALLRTFRVIPVYEANNLQTNNLQRVKNMVNKLITIGWPYYAYKEEVKQFIFEVFLEIYNQNYGIFPKLQQLVIKQYCKSITIQPPVPFVEPTSFPTIYPHYPTRGPHVQPVTCKDEYLYNRTKNLNIINPTNVIKSVQQPHQCVVPNKQWLVIGDRQLSPYFQTTLITQNVYLSNGCLVQSITVPYQEPLLVYCQPGSNECIVTIPCVLPRIVVGYDYVFHSGGGDIRGSAIIEIQGVPSTIKVTIETNYNRSCAIFDDNVKKLMPTLQVALFLDREIRQVSDAINQFIYSNSWLFSVCEEEMKAFAFRVVQEAFSESNNVFPPLNALRQYCDIIVRGDYGHVYPPTPTLEPLPTRPNTPQYGPAYCIDDYSDEKYGAFNIISPKRVLDIISKPFYCIGPDKQRVLPGKRLYSPQIEETLKINEYLYLEGGCLVQSVTVPYQAQLREDCHSRQDGCVVTVPCVVPRILVGYSFIYVDPGSGGARFPGKVIVEVHNDPLDIPVLVLKENCQVSSILDVTSVLKNFKVTVAPEQRDPKISQEVKALMVDHIQRTGWPFNMYKEEVTYVMIAVVNEAIGQTSNVFGQLPELQRACEQSTPAPITSPTICIDDFSSNRKEQFNRVKSSKVKRLLNIQEDCVSRGRYRYLMGVARLTSEFDEFIQVNDVTVSGVCIVQSITVPVAPDIRVSCSSKPDYGVCDVTIPCVLPYLNIGFFHDTQYGREQLILDLRDHPVDLTVSVSATSFGTCQITKWFDDSEISSFKLSVTKGNRLKNSFRDEIVNTKVQQLINNGWFFSVLHLELRHFVFEVIKETLEQRRQVFPRIPELGHLCSSIVWEETKRCTGCIDAPINVELSFCDDIAARSLRGPFIKSKSLNKTDIVEEKLHNNTEALTNEEVKNNTGLDATLERSLTDPFIKSKSLNRTDIVEEKLHNTETLTNEEVKNNTSLDASE